MFKIGGLYSVHAGGSGAREALFYISLLCVLNAGNCGEKHCAEFGGGCFPSRQLVRSNENSS